MRIVLRCVFAALAYVAGLMCSGAIAPLLHIPQVETPAGVSAEKFLIALLLASPILTFGIAPLSAGLGGRWIQRCSAIALLLYIAIGLNTLLEVKAFSSLLPGNAWAASLMFLLPCAATAAVAAGSGAPLDAPSRLGRFGSGPWAWRLLLAWIAFPVCYFVFGMIIAPIVTPYYRTGAVAGLRIPPWSVLFSTLALRSALFLIASLPAIVLWRKSRGQFILAMGLAHAVTVGVFQLAQAMMLPMVLRVTHSLEITADSFAYAAVLGLLFVRPAPANVRAPELIAAD